METRILSIAAIVFCFGISTASAQVNQRAENQNDRIHQGVKSGELTKKEAVNLRASQKNLHQDIEMAKFRWQYQ